MKTIGAQQRTMYCGANDPISERVAPGEVFAVETTSFTEGYSFDDLHTLPPAKGVAPLTGPIWVEGARAGQTLKIEILKIEVTRDFGAMILIPGKGALGQHLKERQVIPIKIGEGYAHLNDRLKVPLAPMVGKISTAPAGEPVLCNRPGPFGGNMDNTHVCEGAILYLPIFVDGAYLGVGDAHAVMAEGEGPGSAVECEARVMLRLTLVDDLPLTHPLVVSRGKTMATADGENLEEACRTALHNLTQMLARHHGLTYPEAASLAAMAGDLAICQIVNPVPSVKAMVPYQLLPIP
jgi:amidase